jgi:hypothetical protein
VSKHPLPLIDLLITMALPFIAQGDVHLPSDMLQEKLNQVMADDKFGIEFEKAALHVEATIPKEAAGISCNLVTAEEIKNKCQLPDASVMVSGTLSQLALRENAISTLDVGTIKLVMEQATSVTRVKEMMGVIAINIDSWANLDFKDLARADKDGFVIALCLIIFWCDSDGNADISAALKSMATDLTFKFQKLGQGMGLLFKCMCMGRSYIHVGGKRSGDRCGDPGSPWRETHKDTQR